LFVGSILQEVEVTGDKEKGSYVSLFLYPVNRCGADLSAVQG
jgi:hypothetical protein